MRLAILYAILGLWGSAAAAQAPTQGESLATSCSKLGIDDGCSIIAEASKMLGPSYMDLKSGAAEAAFRARGYTNVTPWDTRMATFRHGNRIYLVSKPNSNRLYIVIRGTDNAGDVVQDLKATSYTDTFADGAFYIPPAHGGFRRGMLSIIGSGLLRRNEFDAPLDCKRDDPHRSILARHLCKYGMPSGPGQTELVLVGHSLGAAMVLVGAPAFSGLEYKRSSKDGAINVDRQANWPLTLRAVVAFAPPYAVSIKNDRDAGIKVPEGFKDQWTLLKEHNIVERTVSFINDRDIVPVASNGFARHFGWRFRVDRDDRVTYDGRTAARDLNPRQAHSNVGYCSAVLHELHEAVLCE